jgi:hypothetical protein
MVNRYRSGKKGVCFNAISLGALPEPDKKHKIYIRNMLAALATIPWTLVKYLNKSKF